jgi:hypothetical protein
MNGLSKSLYENITVKAASYTLLPEDNGKLFTTRGATGAVTYTLPAITAIQSGWNATFFNIADQDMIVASGEGDNMVAINDAAADSVAYSSTSQQIGGGFYIVFDGTSFLVMPFLSSDATVITVAT